MPTSTSVRNTIPAWQALLATLLAVVACWLSCRGVAAAGPGSVPASAPAVASFEITVDPAHDRQEIDGFGGAVAFWGYDADEAALRYVLEDLGVTIVRVPGEVSPSGDAAEYRGVLQRVMRIAPTTKVLVSFWQPRSADRLAQADWLDEVPGKDPKIKPSVREAWADEIIARLRLMRNDWGVNVVAASPQNEPNFSIPGTSTCAWEPDALADFVHRMVAPRLKNSGLPVRLAAPDIAYAGHEAAEARRYLPAARGDAVSIFCYHMYDSYKDGDANRGLENVRSRQAALGGLLREQLPGKRVWMTETTGAQWNTAVWHAYGWEPDMANTPRRSRPPATSTRFWWTPGPTPSCGGG